MRFVRSTDSTHSTHTAFRFFLCLFKSRALCVSRAACCLYRAHTQSIALFLFPHLFFPTNNRKQKKLLYQLNIVVSSSSFFFFFLSYISYNIIYLRVPSNLVAIVSRKVFWGASKPLRAGIWMNFDWSHLLLYSFVVSLVVCCSRWTRVFVLLKRATFSSSSNHTIGSHVSSAHTHTHFASLGESSRFFPFAAASIKAKIMITTSTDWIDDKRARTQILLLITQIVSIALSRVSRALAHTHKSSSRKQQTHELISSQAALSAFACFVRRVSLSLMLLLLLLESGCENLQLLYSVTVWVCSERLRSWSLVLCACAQANKALCTPNAKLCVLWILAQPKLV